MLCFVFFNDSQNGTAITTLQFYILIPRNKTLYSLVVTPHSPLFPSPTSLFPVSMGLCILEILCKWNHILWGPCTQLPLSCFEVHSWYGIDQYFVSFYDWKIFHCMDVPHFIHSSVVMGVVTPCLTIWGTARAHFP